jgi:purine-binding chemotaxis protein CheW
MAEVGHIADAPAVGAHADACLVFRAGDVLGALRLGDVAETMRPLPVRPLAGAAAHLAGLTVMRGAPAPVVDVALLLTGRTAPPRRFVAARTPRGPVALATGEVLGVRPVVGRDGPVLVAAAAGLVESVGFVDDEPVFLLRGPGSVPDDVWARVPAGDGAAP